MNVDLLKGLNLAQQEAVKSIKGPLLIIAGPGSGKTRVITHRAAYMCEVYGIQPRQILCVTFTNKAAEEMRTRLNLLLNNQTHGLMVRTFHAFCAWVLRQESQNLGFDSNFTIFDAEDQLAVIKQAVKNAEIDSHQFHIRYIRNTISRAKSRLLLPEAMISEAAATYEEALIGRIYRQYQNLLAKNNGLDFDDLLMKAVELLRHTPKVAEKYQRRFLYLMIDEFQDTNSAQYVLTNLLAQKYRNICVVGDPDQSIYAWRNADLRNILNFQEDFPEAKVVRLEENYRSTETVLAAARHLITANERHFEKDLWTRRHKGQPIIVHEAYDEEEEAQFVLTEIERLVNEEDKNLRDCAVMYRINAQSRALEEACLRRNIPYKLIGGVRFYQRREVKDILAYLRVLQNPSDSISLTRIVNVPPRGIGTQSIEKLKEVSRRDGNPLHKILAQIAQEHRDGITSSFGLTLRPVAAIEKFIHLLERLGQERLDLSVDHLIDSLIERTAYREFLEKDVDSLERWENIREIRAIATEYSDLTPDQSLSSFLEQTSLVSDTDAYDSMADSLTLITLHQAKGLEFPVVFISGMEEGLLPHHRAIDSPDPKEIEEERRLCYVGITRAKDQLYLVRAFRRRLFGLADNAYKTDRPPGHQASRFLQEIPSYLIAPPPTENWRAIPLPSQLQLQVGDKVKHSSFGNGIVMACTGTGSDTEATIAFDTGIGVKRLLLSMAPLERVDLDMSP